MSKRVVIIHGWGGAPDEAWIPWLKQELTKGGFAAFAPAMPDTDHPRIEPWVRALADVAGTPDSDTYFVGHSIGCQTILRYLERVQETVGGAVFVAGWFSLTPESIPTPNEKKIAQPWLETPIDFAKVKKATSRFTAIFSDDDPAVPLADAKLFRERLNAEIIIESGKGHFASEDGVNELPSARKALLFYAEPR